MYLFRSYLIICLFIACFTGSAQTDEEVFQNIFSTALTNGNSYQWVDYLSNEIGGRLSGSYNSEKAIAYTKEELAKLGLSKVWLQPVMVPKWVRGAREYAYIQTAQGKTTTVNVCALGGSIATSSLGVKGSVVEVQSFEELEALGKVKIAGNIVFFNRQMSVANIDPFESYRSCVKFRTRGALEAAKYGAIGVIVRSLSTMADDNPHTGNMTYGDLPYSERIPAVAISTNHADVLSSLLKLDGELKFYFRLNCKRLKDVQSHNVIGEITGTELPNEYILVGAHLDAWDLGDGAHDDGAGVAQAMEVLRLFKLLNIRPKRTIRVVLFANEENGLRGAKAYAKAINQNKEQHIFALESDAGGFTPRGFSFDCLPAYLKQIEQWKPLFEPYLIHMFRTGKSGSDITPLKGDSTVLAGLRPDAQRYFDYHHSSLDTFDKISKRELELGAATMTALVYLYDKYGLERL